MTVTERFVWYWLQEILSRFVDVERTVNQCVLVPKDPDLSFMEQRINAVVGLKHILSLVAPLRQALTQAQSPLLATMADVSHGDPEFQDRFFCFDLI